MKNQGYIYLTLLYLFSISLGLIAFLFVANQDRYHHLKIKQKIIKNQLELKNKTINELSTEQVLLSNSNFTYLTQKTEDQFVFSRYQLILVNKNNSRFPKPDYQNLLKNGLIITPPERSMTITKSTGFKSILSLDQLKISFSEANKLTLLVLGNLEIKNELLISQAENSRIEIIVAENINIKKISNQNSKNSSLLIYSAKGKIEIEKEDLNFCPEAIIGSNNNSQLIAHEITLGAKHHSEKILGCPLQKDLMSWPNYLIIGEKN